MHQEQVFVQAMQDNPGDLALRLVFADWLEEQGDPRGELVRLVHTLTQSVEVPGRPELEARLRSLVEQGVQPIGPFWTNSLGMKFAWIPPGTFLMGGEYWTRRKVTLTKGFFMGVYAVTGEEWQEVGVDRRQSFGPLAPASFIGWEDCQEFVRRLSCRDKVLYRLPSEAEWEYACRAGTTTDYSYGDALSPRHANHAGTSSGSLKPVGSYLPNAFGLHDMIGNVWEWCQDYFGEYPQQETVDPRGPDSGWQRVVRGGSSAWRFDMAPDNRAPGEEYGFRICFGLD